MTQRSSPEERRARITSQVVSILADLSGLDVAAIDPGASFTGLGFDSLFLTQANARFRKEFGIRVTLGQLLGETPTIEALAARIDAELPPDAVPPPAPVVAPVASSGDQQAVRQVLGAVQVAPPRLAPWPGFPADGSPADPIGWLITEQLRIMDEQLELMRAYVGGADGAGRPPSRAAVDACPPRPGRARLMDTLTRRRLAGASWARRRLARASWARR